MKDNRIWIYFLCFASVFVSSIHYAFFDQEAKGKTAFALKVLSNIILFLMCYYFINQASNLMENGKKMTLIMNILYYTSMSIFLLIGILVFLRILQHYNSNLGSLITSLNPK
jgi:predicted Co/Zn/Cd cation transporter (cation efflux family)